MMFPQVCITQKSSIGGVSDFFVVIFSLVFIGHLYQHLFLCSFILNHTSKFSSCKIILFLGCILKFPTWQSFSFLLLLLFGPNFCLDCPFEFLAQRAFYFFIFWPQLLPRPPFWVFSLAGFFSFFFCVLSSLDSMNFWGHFSLIVFFSFRSF